MGSLLIVSTIVCLSGYLTPILIKHVLQATYSRNKTDQTLRSEMKRLEREMSEVSVVNEFAKFTRIQRRYAKIKDELRENASERLSSRNKAQLYLTYGNKLITAIITLILMYSYGKEAVVVLPHKLIWPFENILSWPASHRNSISLTVWMIVVRTVIDTCKQDYF
ncbi:protein GET1-like [Venturia canescens]|uniref:protein GET1-like n=1 Tax=Venturia canescens TaxID=32260 RepID=UPI001C9C06C4|nr:protein GET1-like [Venturia canescens]XP_043278447.1 protein GET1-like [Venturia canescens]